jgi:O-antigen/teichoic acid export membrane protein
LKGSEESGVGRRSGTGPDLRPQMNRCREFFDQLKNSTFVKDTAILTMGTVAAQVISVAAMPVMSRLYSPADFGVLAVFLAVAGIVSTAVTLRYETSILLPREDSEAIKLVMLSLNLLMIIGLFTGAVAWFLPEKIRAVIGVSVLGGWFPIAVLNSIGIALLAVGMAWLNRSRAYGRMAQLRIVQSTAAAVAGITLGIYGVSAGLMIAQIVSFALVSAFVLMSLSALGPCWNKKSLKEVALKHGTAPKFLLPTALLDTVTQQLPVLLITAWFSSESAGQFSMAWKILGLPISLVGAAVGQVFMQRFARIWPDAVSARRLLYRTWAILAAAGVFPTLLVMLFGQQLFTLVLGPAWAESGRMAAVIAPMVLAILISSPTSGIFLVLGLQRLSLYFGAAFLVYRSLCIYAGLHYGNVYYGLAAWAFCELTAIIIYNQIALRKMGK